MWISKHEWTEMQRKVLDLQNQIDYLSRNTGVMSVCQCGIPLMASIEAILAHLNLTAVKTPMIESKVVLVERK